MSAESTRPCLRITVSMIRQSEDNGEWEPETDEHPNPLRSHPALSSRRKLYLADSHSFVHLLERDPQTDPSSNQRQSSWSRDIIDQLQARPSLWQRQRKSSIQAENDFCLKPTNDLICTSPPVKFRGSLELSSGNDYGSEYPSTSGRRNVSGKQAEEEQAGAYVLLRSCVG